MSTLIGYQRVSTDDQHLHLQHDALIKAGVEPDRIYEDTLSGAKTNRPGLEHAIRAARQGDVLIVWRLDRLGRSLKDLIKLAERLEDKGVGMRSLQEQIDTTSASGKLFFHGSLYVTDNEDMASLFLAIQSLRDRPWFPASVRDIRAFRIEQWSDFTGVVKSNISS